MSEMHVKTKLIEIDRLLRIPVGSLVSLISLDQSPDLLFVIIVYMNYLLVFNTTSGSGKWIGNEIDVMCLQTNNN